MNMSTLRYTIRRARKRDVRSIYQIENQSFTKPWKQKSFLRELQLPFSLFYVAEIEREIIAYIIAWNVKSEIQLNKIAVKPEFRLHGIGTALLHYLIAKVQATAQEIHIEVRENNHSALIFYRKNGFIEIGKRKNYYLHEDAILMKREIPPRG